MPLPGRPTPRTPRTPRTQRGFTLIECMVACTIAVGLASMALPGWRGQQLRAARIDAVDALTRLQGEQERHFALHGLYAADLRGLSGVVGVSRQGLYALELAPTGAESYVATARAQGAQAQDAACAALTLTVRGGFAEIGPSARCWNR